MDTTLKVLKIATQTVWLVLSVMLLYGMLMIWRGAPTWWEGFSQGLKIGGPVQVESDPSQPIAATNNILDSQDETDLLQSLSTTEKSCVEKQIGADRLKEIQKGAIPSLAELNKVDSCFSPSVSSAGTSTGSTTKTGTSGSTR